MLVRVYKMDLASDDEYENATFLKAYQEDNFDKLAEFVKSLKDKDLRIYNEWYTIHDFVWSFPEDEENIPSFDIFVYGY